MASWLKAAEDLFEVVDRRAKLAVGEKPEDLAGSSPAPAPAALGSNGRGSQAKRSRQRAKKKHTPNEVTATVDTEKEQTTSEPLELHDESDGNKPPPVIEDIKINTGVPRAKDDGYEGNADGDDSTNETLLLGTISNDETNTGVNAGAENSSSPEDANSQTNGNVGIEKSTDMPDGSQTSATKGNEIVSGGDSPVDSNKNVVSEDGGPTKSLERPQSQTVPEITPTRVHAQPKDFDSGTGPDIQSEKRQEPKDVNSTMKVDEQLNEAQGLLQTAKSTGQSKEARLARVCAGLSSRLQEYKSENAQLEELLVAERELSKSYEAQIKHLQKDLSASKGEVSRVESSLVEALAAKNAEIETLVHSVDSLKKQAALSEGNLASLQENMESIMRNRELTETRMMQALREELAAAERRSEEERAAHNAIKLSFREREVELEQRAIEASTALARIQRTADDRAAKAAELEQKVALLEVECASLNQELQEMEARVRLGQKKSPEDANQTIQVQAWQEEVERARHSQREAESKFSSMEAEVQKMRVEMAAMKRDAEHYSRQEHMELEKRYRELTDLLYYKQTQLETMASEKAAAEFQLEKEVKRLQEAQLEAERTRSSRRSSSSWEEDTDIKTLEPLPLHHRHMAAASIQLQKAAKFLDTGAVRATRFLWRYPTARVILLCYLVFVHLFLMYLLHRLQMQADNYTSKEDAETMALFNNTLP